MDKLVKRIHDIEEGFKIVSESQITVIDQMLFSRLLISEVIGALESSGITSGDEYESWVKMREIRKLNPNFLSREK